MKLRLTDLLDIPRLQSALDSLYLSSGIPSAILDTEGVILAASGRQDVCTKFHRVHPEVRERCAESALHLNRHIHEANPTITHKCLHGLIDSAIPIIIGGEHLGNVFAGQMFREAPDMEYFRAQARAYGFDEEAYIDAVKKVPIIPERASQANLAFIAHLTGMFAEMGLNHTREQEAKQRLRESEERYRSLFGKASDGVIILSPDGKLIEVNESFARMHGYTAGELLRMNIRDLDTPETARLIPDRMRQLLAGEILSFEVRHRHKDGHVFPLEVSAGRITIGGESCLQCFHRDITERKRAEDARKVHLAFREGIVECAAEGICVCHDVPEPPYVRFTVWNSRMTEITGYTMEEINRLGWYQAVYPDPEVQGKAKDRMERMRQGDNLKGEDWEITRSDGTRRAITISTSTLQGSGGSVHVLGLFQDITDRKRAEEEKRNLELQVQQAQKMESLGVLAGGIAHDFNNILMAVLGHSELALEEISPGSPARRNLAEISTAARRAADLCRQMLAYAGKASFALERVSLRDLVEEMAHLLKTAVSKKAVLNLHLERGLPPIEADPSQIRQIVMNLIINASEAIGDRSGTITVSVGATRCDHESLRRTELYDSLPPGLYVHLEVADTGIGMDAQTRSRIFEPFFSTKFTGRGLGLAAALGIVRAHKGALKVRSEPGKGATFKVLFPALEAAEGPPANGSSPPAAWRGKGTILLVDDEESLIDLGARMLEHLGFNVLTAADGLEAVELYRERGKEIDLVLMDLTMPRMDGAKAFDELCRLNPDVPVVVASGYSHEDVASRFVGKTLAGVMQKPYTLAKLRESLAGLLPERL